MARYINEDEFVAWVQEHWCADCQNYNGLRCRACWIDDAIDIVEEVPEADVVPKSEYDAVVSAVDNSTKEFLKLHDKYQEAKREIENLKVLLEMKDVSYAGLKEPYDTDTTALIEAREKTEVEVAREIFAEIYKVMNSLYLSVQHSCVGMHGDNPETMRLIGKLEGVTHLGDGIAELKKKYQEGE